MKMHQITAAVALIGIGIGVSGCDISNSVAATNAADAAPAAVVHDGKLVTLPATSPLRHSVRSEVAASMALEHPFGAPGTIEAAPEKLVKVNSPLTGRLIKIHHTLGDRVNAGDPLFTLDSSDLSTAFGDASKAQAALLSAQQNLERQKTLYEAEIIPKKDYEAAQMGFAQSASDARSSQSRLRQLGVGASQEGHRNYVLRSPIAGNVIDVAGALGSYWNDINAPVMTVADLSSVFLSAGVAEKDLPFVFTGQKVRISLNAYADQMLEGTVKYVGEILDTDTRTTKVRVLIDNRHGKLRPGMFAKVLFAGPQRQAVMVPASALVQNGLYTRVFVEQGAYRYAPRNVVTGVTAGDKVEILSGIKAGERVVVKEGVLLND